MKTVADETKDPRQFLAQVEPEQKRADALAILEMMEAITGEDAVMWGDTIIGFGNYHYRYASGREGDWFLTGFSPRKQTITLYLKIGYEDAYKALMQNLGKYKTGKSCLYIKKLADVDEATLRELIKLSAEDTARENA